MTSGKADKKFYYRHSGYPGGLGRAPTATCWTTARGDGAPGREGHAAPKGPSGRQMLRKLKVYAGPTHPHSAQSPTPLTVDARSTGSACCASRHRSHEELSAPVPKPLIQSTGRRKAAVARVRLRPGDRRQVTVNRGPIDDYFPSATHRMIITEPLRLAEKARVYDIDATMDGGGISGQAGALRLGIARALIELEPSCATARSGPASSPATPGRRNPRSTASRRPARRRSTPSARSPAPGVVTLRFGTDGVRGVASAELTPELVLALGRAAARVLGALRAPGAGVPGGPGHPAVGPAAAGRPVRRPGRPRASTWSMSGCCPTPGVAAVGQSSEAARRR